MSFSLKKIGITTTVPIEIIFASNCVPVDLNNIFITGDNPNSYIENAENEGFPRSTCAWIKGIFSSILNCEDIDTVIGVIEGDCSNTKALLEVLRLNNIKSISFSYPESRKYNDLKEQIEKLCKYFNVSMEEVVRVKRELDEARKKAKMLDELTWKHNKATGFENHIWQLCCSDFNGDVAEFNEQITNKICEIKKREKNTSRIRIGYIGVPPINSDLYDFVESLGARIVFNEVQRQFSMAHGIENDDLVEVYRDFTYPYSIEERLKDINEQIKVREINGIIHYTQAFCFRAIEDIVVKKVIDVPVLTIEGDRPVALDARTKLRIESFIEMIDEGEV